MSSNENCATTWLGGTRFTVTIPKHVMALNRPLRTAELEAMSRAPRISPDNKVPAVLDSCLSGLAMRAPLLCAMFRPRS
jgi:hypothetical protein